MSAGGRMEFARRLRDEAKMLKRWERTDRLMWGDKAMYVPIWELGFVHAPGPHVAESGLGLITGWACAAPYEDVKLKGQ
jgi:hypothetical protein